MFMFWLFVTETHLPCILIIMVEIKHFIWMFHVNGFHARCRRLLSNINVKLVRLTERQCDTLPGFAINFVIHVWQKEKCIMTNISDASLGKMNDNTYKNYY